MALHVKVASDDGQYFPVVDASDGVMFTIDKPIFIGQSNTSNYVRISSEDTTIANTLNCPAGLRIQQTDGTAVMGSCVLSAPDNDAWSWFKVASSSIGGTSAAEVVNLSLNGNYTTAKSAEFDITLKCVFDTGTFESLETVVHRVAPADLLENDLNFAVALDSANKIFVYAILNSQDGADMTLNANMSNHPHKVALHCTFTSGTLGFDGTITSSVDPAIAAGATFVRYSSDGLFKRFQTSHKDLVITNTGNVGIGLATDIEAAEKLHVDGTVLATSHLLAPSGNLGVGTAAPVARMHLRDGNLLIDSTASSITEDIGSELVISTSKNTAALSSTQSDFPVVIAANHAISSSTGIAFTSSSNASADHTPGASVTYTRTGGTAGDFSGDLKFNVANSGGATGPLTNAVIVKSDGKVGIGISNPDAQLHVAGRINAKSATGDGGVDIGAAATTAHIDFNTDEYHAVDSNWHTRLMSSSTNSNFSIQSRHDITIAPESKLSVTGNLEVSGALTAANMGIDGALNIAGDLNAAGTIISKSTTGDGGVDIGATVTTAHIDFNTDEYNSINADWHSRIISDSSNSNLAIMSRDNIEIHALGGKTSFMSGNVGVGTAEPTEALHVTGKIGLGTAVISGNTGDYGTIQVDGDTNGNGWSGYSCNGRVVFMNHANGNAGIYNDVNNQWILQSVLNSYTKLMFAGSTKLETTSGGVSVSGTLWASAVDTNNFIYRYGGNWARFEGFTGNTTILNINTSGDGIIKKNGAERLRFRSDGTHYSGIWRNWSDDRLKTGEEYIENARVTLNRLKPQIYDKVDSYSVPDSNDMVDGEVLPRFRQSGLIAQEVFAIPELRHLVSVPDTANSNIYNQVYDDHGTPQTDPDYSDWGSNTASLDYIGLIPYLIRGVQEIDGAMRKKMGKGGPGIVFAPGDIVGITSKSKVTDVYDDAATFAITDGDKIVISGACTKATIGPAVGDYLVPIRNADGKIECSYTNNVDFDQYRRSVGKVICVESNIIVIKC